MGEIVQMSKDRDHTKGFGEIRSMSMVKEKDSDLKTWAIASGEKNLKSILFSGKERNRAKAGNSVCAQ